MVFRLVTYAALTLASGVGCAGRAPLGGAPDADAASQPAIDAVDASVISDAALEAYEGLGPMIGVVACPGGIAGGVFDVTSCWTPTDSPDRVQAFCHPLNGPGGSWLRVLVQRPGVVITNAPLPVGDTADAAIVVEVVDNPTSRQALLEATSGTAILDHYEPDPVSPHFGGRLLDIQLSPLPPTGAICRMPTTSFYSR
jgi:hypothetical protein